MKRIIFLIAVLFSFGANAQMQADSIPKEVLIGFEYVLVDTFTQGSEGDIDTLMFSEVMQKDNLPFPVPEPVFPNNDTVYKLKDSYRLDWLRSVKVVRYRKVRKSVWINVEKPVERQMYDLAKKRYQLDYPVDSFWIHSKVKAIIE
ncbi:hypothetical protein KAR91_30060 [Candidatus Pacearchaeota archaeon]|nr:hypothetical protein [Candidatus Pacearchaeota archaeon]